MTRKLNGKSAWALEKVIFYCTNLLKEATVVLKLFCNLCSVGLVEELHRATMMVSFSFSFFDRLRCSVITMLKYWRSRVISKFACCEGK